MSDRATRERKLPGWWTLARDILSFAGGWWLIFTEAQRPEIREFVMMFAGVVIGIPGLAVGASTVLETLRRGGTGESPSPPAEPPASPSS